MGQFRDPEFDQKLLQTGTQNGTNFWTNFGAHFGPKDAEEQPGAAAVIRADGMRWPRGKRTSEELDRQEFDELDRRILSRRPGERPNRERLRRYKRPLPKIVERSIRAVVKDCHGLCWGHLEAILGHLGAILGLMHENGNHMIGKSWKQGVV